jgi:biopolymer transport protein ExbD
MKRRTEEQLETPITSLIDVVFQLIIFFVVTAAQQKDLVDQNLSLAQARYAQEPEKQDPNTIIINVHKDGAVNIALQPLAPTQLHQILRATVAQAGSAVPVVLRCDGRTLYHDVDKVMTVVGKAGLYRVKIAAVATQ